MDDIKREEFEKACKREKNHKVWVRMVAVRMVRVSNMSVEETQYPGTLSHVGPRLAA